MQPLQILLMCDYHGYQYTGGILYDVPFHTVPEQQLSNSVYQIESWALATISILGTFRAWGQFQDTIQVWLSNSNWDSKSGFWVNCAANFKHFIASAPKPS